jgi:hypothetical protein
MQRLARAYLACLLFTSAGCSYDFQEFVADAGAAGMASSGGSVAAEGGAGNASGGAPAGQGGAPLGSGGASASAKGGTTALGSGGASSARGGASSASGGATSARGGASSASGGAASGACSGVSFASACWYLGATSASCTDTCVAHGNVAVSAAATIGVTQQGGSAANCVKILALLGVVGNVSQGTRSDGLGLGCHLLGTNRWWLSSPPYSATASAATARRVCGCNS